MSNDFPTNEQIRSKTVRLIQDEQMIGVISYNEAMTRARALGLDLVMVAESDPPVCRILDADRFRFERAKQDREQARRQRELIVDTKEVQLRYVTDENDLAIKARRARGFLEAGDKVKVVVRFRGREGSHRDAGRRVVMAFLSQLGDHKIDKPFSDGDRDLMVVVAPMLSKAERRKMRTRDGE